MWVWVNTYRYTFLVGWTSIYQLFWGSLGTRVLTHPHVLLYGKGTTTRTQPQSAWEWFLPAHPPPEAVSPLPGFHNWGNPCYWMVYKGNSYWNGWFGGTSPIYDTVISPEFLEILFYTILCIIYCLKPADQVSQWRLRQVGRQGANWKLELLRHLNPWVALVQRQSLQ